MRFAFRPFPEYKAPTGMFAASASAKPLGGPESWEFISFLCFPAPQFRPLQPALVQSEPNVMCLGALTSLRLIPEHEERPKRKDDGRVCVSTSVRRTRVFSRVIHSK